MDRSISLEAVNFSRPQGLPLSQAFFTSVSQAGDKFKSSNWKLQHNQSLSL
jgi:hypothetical protein